MAASGVTLIKSFLYRGNREEWGNTYHFFGDPPGSDSDWDDLVDALVALEKECIGDYVRYERAYCYEDTDHDSVYTSLLYGTARAATGAETLTTGATFAPGDAAAWVRWKTARVNTHGKPIYLRKYFHGVILAAAGDSGADALSGGQVTALATFGAAVAAVSGSWPGLAGPDGVAPGAMATSTFVTTRTLRRRGARPS